MAMTNVENIARGEGEKYFGLYCINEHAETTSWSPHVLLFSLICKASFDPLGLKDIKDIEMHICNAGTPTLTSAASTETSLAPSNPSESVKMYSASRIDSA